MLTFLKFILHFIYFYINIIPTICSNNILMFNISIIFRNVFHSYSLLNLIKLTTSTPIDNTKNIIKISSKYNLL